MRVLAMDIGLKTYVPGWERLPMQYRLVNFFMAFYNGQNLSNNHFATRFAAFLTVFLPIPVLSLITPEARSLAKSFNFCLTVLLTSLPPSVRYKYASTPAVAAPIATTAISAVLSCFSNGFFITI